MIIKIPFKTPSVNHLYGFRGSRKFLTTEAKKLREEIIDIAVKEFVNVAHLRDKPLKVTTYIYEEWYCKNGSVKRADIANREKFLIDSVFDALGIDDKFIFSHTMIKKSIMNNEATEQAVIEIESL